VNVGNFNAVEGERTKVVSVVWLMLNTLSGDGLVVCWMFGLSSWESSESPGEVKCSENV
jgi:hypothetical protein